jgi:alkylation response protein AidB-like acyl-CoA dehydrogenase
MDNVVRSAEHASEAVAMGRAVGAAAGPHAARHDAESSFVSEGYEAVRDTGYHLLAIPQDLGGHGHGLLGVCRGQAAIARECASTSLAIGMHQHATMTLAWRRSKGDEESERALRLVVDEGLILSATGTLNPAMINVELRPCDGGFVLNGQRRLCSGSPGADALVTAANLMLPEGKQPVLVLAPLQTDGVEIVDDWHAMGMRGSGSNTVRFTDVFVEREYALYVDQPARLPRHRRPRNDEAGREGGQPGILMPGLHISLPIIAASYLGAATGVRDAALEKVAGTPRAKNPSVVHLAGLLTHEVRTGWWALQGIAAQTTDDTLGTTAQMVTTMLGKRQIVLSSIRAAELAMELLGSQSYMNDAVFERVLRDVRAGVTHPLPPENTLMEVGRVAIAEAAADHGAQPRTLS